MIKRLVAFSLLIVFLVFQFFTDINSEVVYINEKPMQTIIPEGDNDIEVMRQTVTIDNTDATKGKVSDKYTLSNTSDKAVSIPIVFPAIGWSPNSQYFNIYVDDEIADYRIRWLLDSEKYNFPSVNEEKVLSTDPMQILEDIKYKKDYKYENINYDDKVLVYEIHLSGNSNQILVENSEEELKLLYMGNDKNKYRSSISSHQAKFVIDEGSSGKFYVVLFADQANDINFVCNQNYVLREMKLLQFVRQIIDGYYSYNSKLTKPVSINTEIVPKIMYFIDQEMKYNEKKSVNINPEKLLKNSIDIVCFNVNFEPNQSKTVELKYEMEGSMDKRKTEEPTYRYEYDFSSSKLWKTYRGLEMKVKVGQNYKYFVDSSVKFKYDEVQNQYTTLLYSLPKDVISYSIYKDDVILSQITDIRTKKKFEIVVISLGMILIVFIAMKIACIGMKE